MKYVIEIKENGNTTFPKSSHDISELKEWIHKNYPTAYQLQYYLRKYLVNGTCVNTQHISPRINILKKQ